MGINYLEGVYTVDISCSNCGYESSLAIPKGEQVSSQGCPRCGCHTVHRDKAWIPKKPYRFGDDPTMMLGRDLVDRIL